MVYIVRRSAGSRIYNIDKESCLTKCHPFSNVLTAVVAHRTNSVLQFLNQFQCIFRTTVGCLLCPEDSFRYGAIAYSIGKSIIYLLFSLLRGNRCASLGFDVSLQCSLSQPEEGRTGNRFSQQRPTAKKYYPGIIELGRIHESLTVYYTNVLLPPFHHRQSPNRPGNVVPQHNTGKPLDRRSPLPLKLIAVCPLPGIRGSTTFPKKDGRVRRLPRRQDETNAFQACLFRKSYCVKSTVAVVSPLLVAIVRFSARTTYK